MPTLGRNRPIFARTIRGFAQGVVDRRSELRHHVVREAWTVAKRYAARDVVNIELREIPALHDLVIEGYLDDYQRLVIAGLARGLGCRSFFEFGTNRGRATWAVVHNNPDLKAYTLDVRDHERPDDTAFQLGDEDRAFFGADASCGEAFHGTPEEARITQLWGDSAQFDYGPYLGTIDLVYIDGAHTYEYVRSDTDNAFRMLSPAGTIVWDDYTTGAGVYRYLTEAAATFASPVYHVLGTRMAICGRQEFVRRLPFNSFESLPTV